MTGYEVSSLTDTLAKTESLGVSILVQPYSSSGRTAAIVEFPGGYVAEIHEVSAEIHEVSAEIHEVSK
jgi:hypothetical protein